MRLKSNTNKNKWVETIEKLPGWGKPTKRYKTILKQDSVGEFRFGRGVGNAHRISYVMHKITPSPETAFGSNVIQLFLVVIKR
jgi:hypothetical protein